MKALFLAALAVFSSAVAHAENNYSDLPPHAQVDIALKNHANVLLAETNFKQEQINQQKWNSGSYEFNLRAGSAQRRIANTGQTLREWDVALERPVRLPNKVTLDSEIGAASVARADYALGDARHEAGRELLHLWFNWQREQAQEQQWELQANLLNKQAQMIEKRVQLGDAPKMELLQAQASAAQARVSLRQAELRVQLARTALTRQFPMISPPEDPTFSTPQPINPDVTFWQRLVFADNHELGMAQAERQLQTLLARRGRADKLPDPTVGARFSSEMGGNEKVAGVYVSVPLSLGLRSANASNAQYQAEAAAQRESMVRRRLENDVQAAHAQAMDSYVIWQQASTAADSVLHNTDLVLRAYKLGESSLSDLLTARRLALESTLAESMAQLDANEARYRLLLDSHQLWPLDEHDAHHD